MKTRPYATGRRDADPYRIAKHQQPIAMQNFAIVGILSGDS